MKKIKEDIITSIASRTGLTEKDTVKIVNELAKIFKEKRIKEQASVVPGFSDAPSVYTNISSFLNAILLCHKKTYKDPQTNSRTLNDPDNVNYIKGASNQNIAFRYYNSVRQHIIAELSSDEKSDEILGRFLKISSLPNKLLAEKIFEISTKTLYSYRHSGKKLPVRLNEQILKLEELYKKGIELFESADEFNKWLKSESFGLGNMKPINLLNSITGIDLVFEELVRMEFGATA
ncbi:MAG TPA: hypothetical protein DDW27_14415 [Bacteroidales bacterium]|nr:hypothetical protein [Bacteroidales bacterium]